MLWDSILTESIVSIVSFFVANCSIQYLKHACWRQFFLAKGKHVEGTVISARDWAVGPIKNRSLYVEYLVQDSYGLKYWKISREFHFSFFMKSEALSNFFRSQVVGNTLELITIGHISKNQSFATFPNILNNVISIRSAIMIASSLLLWVGILLLYCFFSPTSCNLWMSDTSLALIIGISLALLKHCFTLWAPPSWVSSPADFPIYSRLMCYLCIQGELFKGPQTTIQSMSSTEGNAHISKQQSLRKLPLTQKLQETKEQQSICL